MTEPARGIVFDIDGTLVDTNYLHTLAWWRALRDAGEHVLAADVHRCIGMGSDQLLQTLVGDGRDDLKESWRRQFDPLKREITAFPAAARLLRVVHDRGALVVLASSSEEADIAALLEAVDAGDVIDEVTSSGDVDKAKPAPDVFRAAMDKAGLIPSRAIVVGDTVWDVLAAQRCGLDCVGVRSGGISTAELIDAGAVAVYDGVAALLTALDDSPLGRYLDPPAV
jgi:HAD superfamily hydrolase (TIGR01509 family)